MGYISNIYVCAEQESIDNDVNATSHPRESGLATTDSIRKQPIVVSLKGKIVDYGNSTAEQVITKLKSFQDKGTLVVYTGAVGRITNLLIVNFHEDYTNKVNGGASFEMTLQQIKTAKSAYVATKPAVVTKTEKTTSTKTAIWKVGDKVNFKGGNVYVASDSTFAKSIRGASTVKITKISSLVNAKHIYHVISTDGRNVYGWVDATTLYKTTTVGTTTSNAGKQQTSWSGLSTSSKKNIICHTVKKNESLYTLINKTYKQYNLSIDTLLKYNPNLKNRADRGYYLSKGEQIVIPTG